MIWRAIRWRAGSSLVFLAVSIAAIAAASAGPIYLASANESVLHVALAAQTPATAGYSISPVPGGPLPTYSDLAAIASTIPGGVGPGRRFSRTIISLDVFGRVYASKFHIFDGIDLESRSGDCEQLDIVRGSCPTAPGQVLLSSRTVAYLGFRVGTRFRVGSTVRGSPGSELVVAGIYIAPTSVSSYWWGNNPFAFGASQGTAQFVDDGFMTQQGLTDVGGVIPLSIIAQLPLNIDTVHAAGVPAFESDLNAFTARLALQRLNGASHVASILSAVEAEEQQMRSVIVVIALELVLLALFVLYGVASAMSLERAPDLALAELRGLKRWAIAAVALREPAVLLAIALPIGLLVGWLIVAAVSGAVFVSGTPVMVDSLTVAAAVGAGIAGLLASALGTRGLIRPFPLGESGATAARRATRGLVLVDVVAIVLTSVALINLVTSQSGSGGLSGNGGTGGAGTGSNPLAAIAPALVAVAAGIVAARLLPLLCRFVARATRWTKRVTLGLASRGVMRQPGVARRVLVPAIATCLVVFSVASYEVAKDNRATQALFATGAPLVLNVNVPPGLDLVNAVRRADPSGREAMAAAVVKTTSGTLLAVDSTRFAAVAPWPTSGGPSAVQVARYIGGAEPGPLILSHAVDVRLRLDLKAVIDPAPQLQALFFDESSQSETVINFGRLRAGLHDYVAPLIGACVATCRVDSFTLYWSPGPNTRASSVAAPILFERLETSAGGGGWRGVGAGFSTIGDWAASSSAVTVRSIQDGISAVFTVNPSATPPSLVRNDVPRPLRGVITPAVQTGDGTAADPGQYSAVNLDGSDMTLNSDMTVNDLPEAGSFAALVDLSFAERLQQGTATNTTYQVWLARKPSAGFLAALRADGISIISAPTAAAAASALGRTGPALAFDLFVLAALVAALLAIGSLVFSIASSSRKRAIEITALASVGVPRVTLRRALTLETIAVVLSGVLLGFASGVITVHLTLGSLPEFLPGRVGPTLNVWVPWAPVLAATAVVLAALLVAAVLATYLVMRRATPECLRLSQ